MRMKMILRLAVAVLVLCLVVPGLLAFKAGPDAITAATVPAPAPAPAPAPKPVSPAPKVPVVTKLVLTIGNPVMLVDGARIVLEATPLIRNERTLVPVIAVAKALGATFTYDSVLRQVAVVRSNASLSLIIGSSTATLNGSTVPIDPADARVVPVIAAGTTMLPLRFVVESLGAIVTYKAVSKIITIVWTH